jgi:hypothetical protein
MLALTNLETAYFVLFHNQKTTRYACIVSINTRGYSHRTFVHLMPVAEPAVASTKSIATSYCRIRAWDTSNISWRNRESDTPALDTHIHFSGLCDHQSVTNNLQISYSRGSCSLALRESFSDSCNRSTPGRLRL